MNIRRLLVKHFVLGSWVVLFGKKFHFLRAARVLFPLTVFTGLIVSWNPSDWTLQWYDFVALGILALAYWVGGGWFSFSYFRLYPAKIMEMDPEQQFDYLRAIDGMLVKNPAFSNAWARMTPSQKDHYDSLLPYMEAKYEGRFAGLSNLIPLGISLAAIVGFVIYWG